VVFHFASRPVAENVELEEVHQLESLVDYCHHLRIEVCLEEQMVDLVNQQEDRCQLSALVCIVVAAQVEQLENE
jgi:predicted peroxiredoxin